MAFDTNSFGLGIKAFFLSSNPDINFLYSVTEILKLPWQDYWTIELLHSTKTYVMALTSIV